MKYLSAAFLLVAKFFILFCQSIEVGAASRSLFWLDLQAGSSCPLGLYITANGIWVSGTGTVRPTDCVGVRSFLSKVFFSSMILGHDFRTKSCKRNSCLLIFNIQCSFFNIQKRTNEERAWRRGPPEPAHLYVFVLAFMQENSVMSTVPSTRGIGGWAFAAARVTQLILTRSPSRPPPQNTMREMRAETLTPVLGR